MCCLSLGWRLSNNVLGHNRLNTPIASAIAVIHLHTSVKSSSTIQLYCIPRRFTLHRTMAFHVLFTTTVLCLTALSVFVAALPQQGGVEKKPLDESCLGCLCEANGECLPHMKCAGEVCGMFGITWGYWSDSGKPVIEGSNRHDSDAYQKCANDAVCARESVIGYMRRFAQDCNNDGVIDCYDYAAIHKLGGFGCSGYLPSIFKSRLLSCQNSIKSLSG